MESGDVARNIRGEIMALRSGEEWNIYGSSASGKLARNYGGVADSIGPQG